MHYGQKCVITKTAYEFRVRLSLRLFSTKCCTIRISRVSVQNFYTEEVVMTESKLVTDNQARELGRMARTVRVPRATFQTALGDGTALKFLRGLVPPQTLDFLGTIEVELPFDLNPAEYYTDERDGLFVYGGFDQGGHLVQQAESLPAGTKFRLNVHEISAKNGATDAQIETALGEGYPFDPTTVCGFYAAMMSAQPNDEEGHLLNNGYASLAYTSFSVAYVRRNLSDWKWHVVAWESGDRGWSRGCRVFSPATAT